MKSKVTENPKIESRYPVLMKLIDKYREDGQIVLFTSQNTGIVVGNGTDMNPLGFYSNNWSKADDEKVWKRFNGKIELSNN